MNETIASKPADRSAAWGARATSFAIAIAIAAAGFAASPARGATDLGNIMPLGDSITYGQGAAGGYRDPLYSRLSEAGYTFTFVGSQTNGATSRLTSQGQAHHEGHGGWVIQARDPGDPSPTGSGRNGLADHVATWVRDLGPEGKPDVVLLMVGSNDMMLTYYLDNAPSRLASLISTIAHPSTGLVPDAHVIVAQIPPTTSGNTNRRTQAFNAAIPGVVAAARAEGHRVSYVNMYDALDPAVDLFDSVHPNAQGYGKIADVWFDGIRAIPEPGVLLMMVGGGLALLRRRRPNATGGHPATAALVAALVVAAALPVGAQAEERAAGSAMPRYGDCQSSRIGGGGYVMNVALCPSDPQRYYSYVDVGGVLRSDDGGRHWRMLHGGLPPRRGNYGVRGLVVDPRNADHLIIATGDRWEGFEGLHVSRDGGETWRQVATNVFFDANGHGRQTGSVLVRHPRSADTVIAASLGTGLWRSDDNGETWRHIGMDGVVPTDLVIDRDDPQRWWLCSQPLDLQVGPAPQPAGLFRSLDGGASWTRLGEQSPDEIVQDPRDPNRLFGLFGGTRVLASSDGGETWRPHHDGLAIDPARGGALSAYGYRALAAGPDFLLVGASNGDLYRLSSEDSVWRKVPREAVDDAASAGIVRGKEMWGWAMSSLVVDPRDPGHWIETDFFGLSQSFDAGRTWTISVDGLENTVIHAVVQDPTNPSRVHLGMGDLGYFRSDDGGVSFRRRALPDNAITCKDVALSARKPERLYAIGPKRWNHHIAQVFVSDDHGETWISSPMTGLPDLTKEMCTSLAVAPDDPQTVYLAVSGAVGDGAGGPYRSRDGGQSWTWIGGGLPAGQPLFWTMPWSQGRELAVDGDGTVVAISRVGASKGVYRFDAGSATWSRGSAEDDLGGAGAIPTSVVADDLAPGRWFVGVRGRGVYRSVDDGVTWQRVYDRSASHVMVDRVVAGRVAASTEDGVILSEDGGTAWRLLDRRLPDRVHGNMPAFAGDRLIVGSYGSGAFWTALEVRTTATDR